MKSSGTEPSQEHKKYLPFNPRSKKAGGYTSQNNPIPHEIPNACSISPRDISRLTGNAFIP
jgi:hypothetical protein